MFKLIFKILEAIFAIIGLIFTGLVFLFIYFCPFDFDYLKERFNINYMYTQSQETPIQNENGNIKLYKDQKGTFTLSGGTTAFVFNLGDLELSANTGEISYTAYYYNPEYTTIFHPLKFVFADNGYLGEERNFQCVKIINDANQQENENECKLFTVNTGFFGVSQKYNKIYLVISAFKDGAEIQIK